MKLPHNWIGIESSPVDWCEPNFEISKHVAEFVNTISNILFFLIPLLSLTSWKRYANVVSHEIYLSLALFFGIGVSSTYFHATLSLLGQLLDELSILWLLIFKYCCIPDHYLPNIFMENRRFYHLFLVMVGFIVTSLSLIYPQVNQYALIVIGLPLTWILRKECNLSKNRLIQPIAYVCLGSFFVALFFWIIDKSMCQFWRKLHLTICHGIWHIIMCISGYLMIVLSSYFYAIYNAPDVKPSIQFWPSKNRELGIPYVDFL